MALANYTDLQAAIALFLFNRTDLSALIPDFITLAQTQINIDMSVAPMELEQAVVGVVNSRNIDISSLIMNEPRGLYLTLYSPRKPMEFVLPEMMTVYTSPGLPIYWTIDGQKIAFDKPCDQAYPFSFRYVGQWALSAAAPTNFLMTGYPNVYLYASLLQAAPYLGDDSRVALWGQMYDKAVRGAQTNINRSRTGLSTLRVDVGLQRRRPLFSILQG